MAPAQAPLTALDLDEAQLLTLRQVANRLLAGRPTVHGPMRASGRPPPPRGAVGGGHDFLDFVPHGPGLDARAIDWRASERAGRMLVRRYRREDASANWWVCLDRSASMGVGQDAKWRLAAQLAAAFMYLLLERGERAGLILFSDGIDSACPPGRGRPQLARALAVLAQARPAATGGGSDPSACAAALRARHSAILLSDFLTPDAMTQGLETLLRQGGQIRALQVLDAADEDAAPDRGPMLLRDAESGRSATVRDGAAAGRVARARLASLQAELRGFCRTRGIALTQTAAPADWRAVVIDHLRQAAGDA